jgi:hypothetical protein
MMLQRNDFRCMARLRWPGLAVALAQLACNDGPAGTASFGDATGGATTATSGYDDADSYAYLGGAGTAVINPNPAG